MKTERVESIDYLRALMSVLVVVWHMGAARRSLIFSRDGFPHHVFTLSDFFGFHVLVLAVPTFMLVSHYLFVLRGATPESLRRRVKRVLILLSFWPLALILYRQGYQGVIELVPRSFASLAAVTLTAGHTIYYFFVSLLITLPIAYAVAKRRTLIVCGGFVLSIICLAALPWATQALRFYPLSAYWSPLNFLPYPFVAVLAVRFFERGGARAAWVVCGALLLAVAFALIEWRLDTGMIFFAGNGFAIPCYTRASLVFAASAVLVAAIGARLPAVKAVGFMARHSLALYCLHPFFMGPVTRAVSAVAGPGELTLWCSIALVILSSYAGSVVLRLYLKDEVLR